MTATSSDNRLSLGFVGDICLSLGVIDVVRRLGGAFPFDGTRHLYDRFDLTTGNLECCIVNDESRLKDSQPPLDVPLDVADALVQSGIGVFCLANNHILDRDAQGLLSTLDFLARGFDVGQVKSRLSLLTAFTKNTHF